MKNSPTAVATAALNITGTTKKENPKKPPFNPTILKISAEYKNGWIIAPGIFGMKKNIAILHGRAFENYFSN